MARRFRAWLERAEQRLPPKLRRLAHDQGRHLLAPNRRSVARGCALGVFLGITVPLGQFVAAFVLAPIFRANVIAAMGATLITNPLTLPAVYAAAFLVGDWIRDLVVSFGRVPEPLPLPELGRPSHRWMMSMAMGLGVFSIAGALVAYWLVDFLWSRAARRSWLRRRRARLRARAAASAAGRTPHGTGAPAAQREPPDDRPPATQR